MSSRTKRLTDMRAQAQDAVVTQTRTHTMLEHGMARTVASSPSGVRHNDHHACVDAELLYRRSHVQPVNELSMTLKPCGHMVHRI